jgi:hypothetical protein
MKYIYLYPVETFERNTDDETIVRAWKNGEVERYTPELFAELINDQDFCDINNWVRVIEEKTYNDGYFEISSLHRDDLEATGYDTAGVDDASMNKLASKLGDDYCEQLFWSSLSIIAGDLNIPERKEKESA